MTLKLGPIADDKPVRMTIDVPADVHRDLIAYAEAHAAATGQPSQGRADARAVHGERPRLREDQAAARRRVNSGRCQHGRGSDRTTGPISFF